MSDNNEPVFEFELPYRANEPEFSAYHYKQKLTLNQLTFCNHYIKHRNADAAYRHAYPKQKALNPQELQENENVVNFIVCRLREKETTLDDVYESTMQHLHKLAADESDPKRAKEARRLIHDSKTKLADTIAKWEAKLEMCKSAKEVGSSQPVIINVLPASPLKD